jgi:hypothetical protein
MRVQSKEEARITSIKIKGKRDTVDTLEALHHTMKKVRMMFTQE